MKVLRVYSVNSLMDTTSGILSNAINDFFREEKLAPEDLIDIKYSTDYDSKNNYDKGLQGELIFESALIIYLEEQ